MPCLAKAIAALSADRFKGCVRPNIPLCFFSAESGF
jgi:hypothetical protein